MLEVHYDISKTKRLLQIDSEEKYVRAKEVTLYLI